MQDRKHNPDAILQPIARIRHGVPELFPETRLLLEAIPHGSGSSGKYKTGDHPVARRLVAMCGNASLRRFHMI